ncbi:MAG: hypothetical protein K0R94_185 [Burkholderiales bacterium]|jgi:hypothetical protein|nr:hypothetical protein [Burkholderiales bacterium]
MNKILIIIMLTCMAVYVFADEVQSNSSNNQIGAVLEQQTTNPNPGSAFAFAALGVNPFKNDLNNYSVTNENNIFKTEKSLRNKIDNLNSTKKIVNFCSSSLKVKFDNKGLYCANMMEIFAYDKYIVNGLQMQVDMTNFLKNISNDDNTGMKYIELFKIFNKDLDSLLNRTSVSTN